MKKSFLKIFCIVLLASLIGCRAQYPERYFKKSESSLFQGLADILYCYQDRFTLKTDIPLLQQQLKQRQQNLDLNAPERVVGYMKVHEFDEIWINKEQKVIHLIDYNFQVTFTFLYYYDLKEPNLTNENDLNGKITFQKLAPRWYLRRTELEGI